MKKAKLLIIILLLLSCSLARGQVTNLQKVQEYDLILEADRQLGECQDFETYKSVYQYLIYGFSELGANMAVDFMVRLPYFEYLDATDEQKNEIQAIASQYERVKIGKKAPDIQCVTIDNKCFDLDNIENDYTVILFWSYSCPHCHELLQELADFAKENKNFAIVTVNVSGEMRKVKRLLRKLGLKKHYNICDGQGWNSPIVADYAVDMTPSMFLLDKDKTIIGKPFNIDDIINSVEL